MTNVLAIDLGASTGRAIIGMYQNNKLELEEIHRFDDYVIVDGDNITWNLEKIMTEIHKSIKQADEKYGFDSLAIDTWGVDFGLLDTEGNLIRNPVHYRDTRTQGMIEEVGKKVSLDYLYEKTGIQIMDINTLFQLYHLKEYEPEVYEKVDKILLMPDLINYLLTNEKFAEKSIASTTQLFNPHTMDWDVELIEELGFKESLFPTIISAGKEVGTLSKELQEKLNVNSKKVIAVTGHDTACAITSVPTTESNPLYLSSGTWSLLGKEIKDPIITNQAKDAAFSNEVGSDDNITFLSNITGLWIIQETKKYLDNQGDNYSFAEIASKAKNVKDSNSYINVDDSRFGEITEMPKVIKEYLEETNQEVFEDDSHLFRIIYESLAMKYRERIDEISTLTSEKDDVLYIIGGGSKADILNQLTANVTGKTVIAGPGEATSYGNIILQLVSLDDLTDLNEGRNLLNELEELKTYHPEDGDTWSSKYMDYKERIGEES